MTTSPSSSSRPWQFPSQPLTTEALALTRDSGHDYITPGGGGRDRSGRGRFRMNSTSFYALHTDARGVCRRPKENWMTWTKGKVTWKHTGDDVRGAIDGCAANGEEKKDKRLHSPMRKSRSPLLTSLTDQTQPARMQSF